MPSELPSEEDSLESWQRDELRQCAQIIKESVGPTLRLLFLLETMHEEGSWRAEWDDFGDYCWQRWDIPCGILWAWRGCMEGGKQYD